MLPTSHFVTANLDVSGESLCHHLIEISEEPADVSTPEIGIAHVE